MALLAFGNRLLWMGRGSSSTTMSSTLGSPALFDNAVVSEGVSTPGRSTVGAQYVGYDHTSGVTRAQFRFDMASEGGGAAVTSPLFEIVGTSGTPIAEVRIGTTASIVQFRSLNTSSVMTQRGADLSAVATGLTSYVIDFTSGANGEVNIYRGGSLWHSATWTGGNSATIGGIRLYNFASGTQRTVYSQFAMSDGDDLRGFLVQSVVITGTGFHNDGTGLPADTGDADITTAKGLSTADDRWSGTKPTVTLPSGAALEQVAVNLLARATSPVPNARILVRRAGNDSYDSNLSPALSSGYTARSRILTLDPTTGLPWDLSNFNASEFGLQARA
jgi:hypothetical protein